MAADEWAFGIHSGPKGRNYCARPPTAAGKLVHAGAVRLASYDKLLQRMGALLHQAQERIGQARSATRNEQGHQKTPVTRNARRGVHPTAPLRLLGVALQLHLLRLRCAG